MPAIIPEKSFELLSQAERMAAAMLEYEREHLRTAVKRFLMALEEIARLPCASDLPLCHNPGCASCRARRALEGSPGTGRQPADETTGL